MKTHILIPNMDSYAIMLLIVLSLGSFNIARQFHIRWLKNYFSFVGSNALVKSLIAIAGFKIIVLNNLFSWNLYVESCGIVIGLMLGFITIYCESTMINKINRNKLLNIKEHTKKDALQTMFVTKTFSLSANPTKAKGLQYIRQRYSQYLQEPDFLNYSLLSIILVAIAEEFLFRGYIISIAASHNSIISLALILLSTILFACSHISRACHEAIVKLPLAILATLSFILTQTLLTAIILHLTLNIYTYLQLKKRKIATSNHSYLPMRVR